MDGGGESSFFFPTLLLRPGVSWAHSPVAIRQVQPPPLPLPPLKPASNNATALQTEEENRRRWREKKQGQGNRRAERKTSSSRWHQMYLRGSSRGSAERALPQCERLQTGSERQGGEESGRGGWANAHGRQGRIASSSPWFDLIYVTTLKTLGTNKITEDHFGSKSKTYNLLPRFRCQDGRAAFSETETEMMGGLAEMKIK